MMIDIPQYNSLSFFYKILPSEPDDMILEYNIYSGIPANLNNWKYINTLGVANMSDGYLEDTLLIMEFANQKGVWEIESWDYLPNNS